MRVGAGALCVDAEGRILLVEPTYKEVWEVPGGLVDPGESPSAACRRELHEELGLDAEVGRLLVVDFVPATDELEEGLMFVFDGPAVDLDTVQLPPDELASCRYVTVDELGDLVRPAKVRRLTRALEARAEGGTLYCEDGHRHG